LALAVLAMVRANQQQSFDIIPSKRFMQDWDTLPAVLKPVVAAKIWIIHYMAYTQDVANKVIGRFKNIDVPNVGHIRIPKQSIFYVINLYHNTIYLATIDSHQDKGGLAYNADITQAKAFFSQFQGKEAADPTILSPERFREIERIKLKKGLTLEMAIQSHVKPEEEVETSEEQEEVDADQYWIGRQIKIVRERAEEESRKLITTFWSDFRGPEGLSSMTAWITDEVIERVRQLFGEVLSEEALVSEVRRITEKHHRQKTFQDEKAQDPYLPCERKFPNDRPLTKDAKKNEKRLHHMEENIQAMIDQAKEWGVILDDELSTITDRRKAWQARNSPLDHFYSSDGHDAEAFSYAFAGLKSIRDSVRSIFNRIKDKRIKARNVLSLQLSEHENKYRDIDLPQLNQSIPGSLAKRFRADIESIVSVERYDDFERTENRLDADVKRFGQITGILIRLDSLWRTREDLGGERDQKEEATHTSLLTYFNEINESTTPEEKLRKANECLETLKKEIEEAQARKAQMLARTRETFDGIIKKVSQRAYIVPEILFDVFQETFGGSYAQSDLIGTEENNYLTLRSNLEKKAKEEPGSKAAQLYEVLFPQRGKEDMMKEQWMAFLTGLKALVLVPEVALLRLPEDAFASLSTQAWDETIFSISSVYRDMLYFASKFMEKTDEGLLEVLKGNQQAYDDDLTFWRFLIFPFDLEPRDYEELAEFFDDLRLEKTFRLRGNMVSARETFQAVKQEKSRETKEFANLFANQGDTPALVVMLDILFGTLKDTAYAIFEDIREKFFGWYGEQLKAEGRLKDFHTEFDIFLAQMKIIHDQWQGSLSEITVKRAEDQTSLRWTVRHPSFPVSEFNQFLFDLPEPMAIQPEETGIRDMTTCFDSKQYEGVSRRIGFKDVEVFAVKHKIAIYLGPWGYRLAKEDIRLLAADGTELTRFQNEAMRDYLILQMFVTILLLTKCVGRFSFEYKMIFSADEISGFSSDGGVVKIDRQTGRIKVVSPNNTEQVETDRVIIDQGYLEARWAKALVDSYFSGHAPILKLPTLKEALAADFTFKEESSEAKDNESKTEPGEGDPINHIFILSGDLSGWLIIGLLVGVGILGIVCTFDYPGLVFKKTPKPAVTLRREIGNASFEIIRITKGPGGIADLDHHERELLPGRIEELLKGVLVHAPSDQSIEVVLIPEARQEVFTIEVRKKPDVIVFTISWRLLEDNIPAVVLSDIFDCQGAERLKALTQGLTQEQARQAAFKASEEYFKAHHEELIEYVKAARSSGLPIEIKRDYLEHLISLQFDWRIPKGLHEGMYRGLNQKAGECGLEDVHIFYLRRGWDGERRGLFAAMEFFEELDLDWQEHRDLLIASSIVFVTIDDGPDEIIQMVSREIINNTSLVELVHFSDGSKPKDGSLFWIKLVHAALLEICSCYYDAHAPVELYTNRVKPIFIELIQKDPAYAGRLFNEVPITFGLKHGEEWITKLFNSFISLHSDEPIISFDDIARVTVELNTERVFQLLYQISPVCEIDPDQLEENNKICLIRAVHRLSPQKIEPLMQRIDVLLAEPIEGRCTERYAQDVMRVVLEYTRKHIVISSGGSGSTSISSLMIPFDFALTSPDFFLAAGMAAGVGILMIWMMSVPVLTIKTQTVYLDDNKRSSELILCCLLERLSKHLEHSIGRQLVGPKDDYAKGRFWWIQKNVAEIQITGNQGSSLINSELINCFVFQRNFGYISDIGNFVALGLKPMAKRTGNIGIQKKSHVLSRKGDSSSLARSAAKERQAWISSSVRGGYSSLILSGVNPKDNASNTTYTGVRVPLTHGLPCWISGLATILSKRLLTFITSWPLRFLSNLLDSGNISKKSISYAPSAVNLLLPAVPFNLTLPSPEFLLAAVLMILGVGVAMMVRVKKSDDPLQSFREEWTKRGRDESLYPNLLGYEDFAEKYESEIYIAMRGTLGRQFEERGIDKRITGQFLKYFSYTDLFCRKYQGNYDRVLNMLAKGTDRLLLGMFDVFLKHLALVGETQAESYFLREQYNVVDFDNIIRCILNEKRKTSNRKINILIAGCGFGQEIISWKTLVRRGLKRSISDFEEFELEFIGMDKNETVIRGAEQRLKKGYDILTALSDNKARNGIIVKLRLDVMDEFNARPDEFNRNIRLIACEMPSSAFSALLKEVDLLVINRVIGQMHDETIKARLFKEIRSVAKPGGHLHVAGSDFRDYPILSSDEPGEHLRNHMILFDFGVASMESMVGAILFMLGIGVWAMVHSRNGEKSDHNTNISFGIDAEPFKHARSFILSAVSTHITKPKAVLVDIGSADSKLSKDIEGKNSQMTTYSVDAYFDKKGDPRHRVAKAEQMPFGDEFSDGVIFSFSLSYMKKNDAFQEASRILKPNGKVILILHHPDSFLLSGTAEDAPLQLTILEFILNYLKMAIGQEIPEISINEFGLISYSINRINYDVAKHELMLLGKAALELCYVHKPELGENAYVLRPLPERISEGERLISKTEQKIENVQEAKELFEFLQRRVFQDEQEIRSFLKKHGFGLLEDIVTIHVNDSQNNLLAWGVIAQKDLDRKNSVREFRGFIGFDFTLTSPESMLGALLVMVGFGVAMAIAHNKEDESEAWGLDLLRLRGVLENLLFVEFDSQKAREFYIKQFVLWAEKIGIGRGIRPLLFERERILKLREEVRLRAAGQYISLGAIRSLILEVLRSDDIEYDNLQAIVDFLIDAGGDQAVRVKLKSNVPISIDHSSGTSKIPSRGAIQKSEEIVRIIDMLDLQLIPDDVRVYRSVMRPYAGLPGTMSVNQSNWGVGESGFIDAKRAARVFHSNPSRDDVVIIQTTVGELRKRGVLIPAYAMMSEILLTHKEGERGRVRFDSMRDYPEEDEDKQDYKIVLPLGFDFSFTSPESMLAVVLVMMGIGIVGIMKNFKDEQGDPLEIEVTRMKTNLQDPLVYSQSAGPDACDIQQLFRQRRFLLKSLARLFGKKDCNLKGKIKVGYSFVSEDAFTQVYYARIELADQSIYEMALKAARGQFKEGYVDFLQTVSSKTSLIPRFGAFAKVANFEFYSEQWLGGFRDYHDLLHVSHRESSVAIQARRDIVRGSLELFKVFSDCGHFVFFDPLRFHDMMFHFDETEEKWMGPVFTSLHRLCQTDIGGLMKQLRFLYEASYVEVDKQEITRVAQAALKNDASSRSKNDGKRLDIVIPLDFLLTSLEILLAAVLIIMGVGIWSIFKRKRAGEKGGNVFQKSEGREIRLVFEASGNTFFTREGKTILFAPFLNLSKDMQSLLDEVTGSRLPEGEYYLAGDGSHTIGIVKMALIDPGDIADDDLRLKIQHAACRAHHFDQLLTDEEGQRDGRVAGFIASNCIRVIEYLTFVDAAFDEFLINLGLVRNEYLYAASFQPAIYEFSVSYAEVDPGQNLMACVIQIAEDTNPSSDASSKARFENGICLGVGNFSDIFNFDFASPCFLLAAGMVMAGCAMALGMVHRFPQDKNEKDGGLTDAIRYVNDLLKKHPEGSINDDTDRTAFQKVCRENKKIFLLWAMVYPVNESFIDRRAAREINARYAGSVFELMYIYEPDFTKRVFAFNGMGKPAWNIAKDSEENKFAISEDLGVIFAMKPGHLKFDVLPDNWKNRFTLVSFDIEVQMDDSLFRRTTNPEEAIEGISYKEEERMVDDYIERINPWKNELQGDPYLYQRPRQEKWALRFPENYKRLIKAFLEYAFSYNQPSRFSLNELAMPSMMASYSLTALRAFDPFVILSMQVYARKLKRMGFDRKSQNLIRYFIDYNLENPNIHKADMRPDFRFTHQEHVRLLKEQLKLCVKYKITDRCGGYDYPLAPRIILEWKGRFTKEEFQELTELMVEALDAILDKVFSEGKIEILEVIRALRLRDEKTLGLIKEIVGDVKFSERFPEVRRLAEEVLGELTGEDSNSGKSGELLGVSFLPHGVPSFDFTSPDSLLAAVVMMLGFGVAMVFHNRRRGSVRDNPAIMGALEKLRDEYLLSQKASAQGKIPTEEQLVKYRALAAKLTMGEGQEDKDALNEIIDAEQRDGLEPDYYVGPMFPGDALEQDLCSLKGFHVVPIYRNPYPSDKEALSPKEAFDRIYNQVLVRQSKTPKIVIRMTGRPGAQGPAFAKRLSEGLSGKDIKIIMLDPSEFDWDMEPFPKGAFEDGIKGAITGKGSADAYAVALFLDNKHRVDHIQKMVDYYKTKYDVLIVHLPYGRFGRPLTDEGFKGDIHIFVEREEIERLEALSRYAVDFAEYNSRHDRYLIDPDRSQADFIIDMTLRSSRLPKEWANRGRQIVMIYDRITQETLSELLEKALWHYPRHYQRIRESILKAADYLNMATECEQLLSHIEIGEDEEIFDEEFTAPLKTAPPAVRPGYAINATLLNIIESRLFFLDVPLEKIKQIKDILSQNEYRAVKTSQGYLLNTDLIELARILRI
ncbi:MAG: methyltransferase domain-containing protein, partial [Candidatus Omnitrophota bacterium]